ncbi:CASL protein, partial [Amia calva]|nr:CASL protein [Amia calva]
MKYKNLMAKALYDNVPESPEELAFRKGDILTVIEQNTGGLEGWWLCSLHGRQGIAPGNRLKLLIGPMFDGQSPSQQQQFESTTSQSYQKPGYPVTAIQNSTSNDPLYQVPPSHQNQQGTYQVPPSHTSLCQDVYQVPPSLQRSPWAAEGMPNKVMTPTRVGQTYACESSSRYQKDVYDVPPTRPQGVYDIPPAKLKGSMFPGQLGEPRAQGVYDIPPTNQGIYSIPPSACREREGNYDFPPPMKLKPEGVYDVPPTTIGKSPEKSNYDFPPSSELASQGNNGIYDIPPSQLLGNQLSSQTDVYDIPRGMQPAGKPRAPTDRSTERGKGVYDIQPQVSQDSKAVQDITDGINRLSFSSTGSTRSNMSTSSTTSKESCLSTSPLQEIKLLLDLDTAIQRISWLYQVVESSIAALMGHLAPNWRSYDYMEKHVNEIHTAVDKVMQALTDFMHFSKGAAANASGLTDLTLYNKLKKHLQRLDDSNQILSQTRQALDVCNWSLNILVINKAQNKCDSLERFIMVSRTVPDDVKQLASAISTNAELLFKRVPNGSFSTAISEQSGSTDYIYNSPQSHVDQEEKDTLQSKTFPSRPNVDDKANINSSEKGIKSWMEDYDYVHLQGKEEFERQQKELLEKENIIKQNKIQLEQEQLNQFKQLEKEVIKPVENDISTWSGPQNVPHANGGLCTKDKQLLFFYSEQCETHFVTLLNAIDAFFSCISVGQPPRIFVAHSKFVILSAHKLVFIGDTLSRQAATLEVRNKVMNCSNILCELLKTIVSATKIAALHYPSTAAVQEMVDRVTELSHHAQQFKVQLLQMASL